MPKILYKYRGVEPWGHFLNFLLHQRLYAANFKQLNESMEGTFTYSKTHVSPGFIKQIIDNKTSLNICSLGQSHNSTIMWSYYAAGHKGIVLGIEIDAVQDGLSSIEDVEYSDSITFEAYQGCYAEVDAKKILSTKFTAWKHEREVRVFTRAQFVNVKLLKVYFGCEMSDEQRLLLSDLIGKLDPQVELIQMQRSHLDTQNMGNLAN